MKFPPCKHCKHSKSKHQEVEVSQYVGWHKRRKIVKSLRCIDCYNFWWFGPTYEWEYEIVKGTEVEWGHTYEGDNLALLELKSRRYEINKGVII
jgi:hypothetical protein